jgi:hypothetical protein
MKRCPQCEFLYEEDQKLCDMDGTQLMPDSTFQLEKGAKGRASRSIWKLLVEIALPLIVLSFVGFYAFRSQKRTQVVTPAAAMVLGETETSADGKKPADSSSHGVEPSSNDAAAKRIAGPGSDKLNTNKDVGENETVRNSENKNRPNAVDPGARSNLTGVNNAPRGNVEPPARSNHRPLKTQPNSQKKDNRVTSFLKKTGRFLAKPFKT